MWRPKPLARALDVTEPVNITGSQLRPVCRSNAMALIRAPDSWPL